MSKRASVRAEVASMRRAAHAAKVEAMREGRIQRAATYADRKREARRKACRGRHSADE